MKNIELNAAERLLDRGIKVPVTAPLLFRLFGKRKINVVVRMPYLGTLYRISALFLSMGISDDRLKDMTGENIHNLFAKHGKTLTKIVAQALLNGWLTGWLFARPVAAWLYWRLNNVQLLTLADTLVSLTGSDAFTNTIRLVRMMKRTAPNQSQTA
ncbi:hypothetical protein [Mucilaginibacter sp. L3T2-6]|uniref:hypothetical protein n=1 Tax=Mucilaginibacter sp. L3T2-6 TaxID=3062491 RepID=UPI0026745375|nr:hypothetical protein [Mucilaginibacter sp. L3T2-6]MDO3641976.1 hypothetical protein [Mucilaginibacter sp. L3T2-6]MDV6214346.1 hypothetical protein [Mucilaginibacter sp. L3T2-6]